MIKILFVCCVFFTTFSINWLAEARTPIDIFEELECVNRHFINPVCGSDGETYDNIHILECAQETRYGQRIHLRFKRDGGCWVFEKYGVEPSTMICVRKFRIETISRKNTIPKLFFFF